MEDSLLNWAYNSSGVAVAFLVNTSILVYVLKSIDAKLEKLNNNIELYLKERR